MDSILCAKFHLQILSGFEIHLLQLNNNNNNNEKKEMTYLINQVPITPFLGYMLFVAIRISLMCQKLDLISIHTHLSCAMISGRL